MITSTRISEDDKQKESESSTSGVASLSSDDEDVQSVDESPDKVSHLYM